MVSGKSDNSNLNEQFMENLNHSLDIKKSSINKYNMAIDNSSTYYITKKIYGKKSELFEFENKSNTYFDFKFGYQNEVLGKVSFFF
jgi:flagellar biosynthesis chaperone FliJ